MCLKRAPQGVHGRVPTITPPSAGAVVFDVPLPEKGYVSDVVSTAGKVGDGMII